MTITIQPWYTLIPLLILLWWTGRGFFREVKRPLVYWRSKHLFAHILAVSIVGSFTIIVITITCVQWYHGNLAW